MAYKYFSKQIIDKNFDLNNVFPEKQMEAQKRNGVSYNLLDIVIYLKEVTSDFTISDNAYIDMDNAIERVLNNYFKVNPDLVNPFVEKTKEDKKFLEGQVPKDAVILTEEGIESKGNKKQSAAKSKVKNGEEVGEKVVSEEDVIIPVEEPTEPQAPTNKEELKETIILSAEYMDENFDSLDSDEKAAFEDMIEALGELGYTYIKMSERGK